MPSIPDHASQYRPLKPRLCMENLGGLFLVVQLLFCLTTVSALENGLGRTPPMGWNSWNHFNCDIDETVVRETADALVSTGLAKLGYNYVNVDDCWAELQRDQKGALQPRKETFPSGIKALADYVHSKGLKFGIYSDAGYLTCQRQPGSLNYETQDAQTFASWGVDYLKYDNCNNDGSSPRTRYLKMRDALKATGRSIFFSMCEWGQEDPAKWAQGVANSWRTTGDIKDSWDSVLSIADKNNVWSNYASLGGWNDPDMLEVGNGGMSLREYRAHFSLWAMMKAPLILGCDIRKISDDYLAILNNTEVIQINQDSMGVQGRRVNTTGEFEIWSGLITDGKFVMLVLNKGSSGGTARFPLRAMGIPTSYSVKMRDLWKHEDLPGTYKQNVEIYVDSHDAAMFTVTMIPP